MVSLLNSNGSFDYIFVNASLYFYKFYITRVPPVGRGVVLHEFAYTGIWKLVLSYYNSMKGASLQMIANIFVIILKELSGLRTVDRDERED